jgi:exosortase family protein XrtM
MPASTGAGTSLGRLAFPIAFLALFGVLLFAYQQSRDTPVERFLIDHATVTPAVALINLLAPEEGVEARGHRLVSPHARLSVLNGCEGTETMLLMLAAVLVYRASWAHKVVGLALGLGLVYALNQARIVGLYFALRHERQLFDLLHGYLGPTLIIILCAVFFMAWAEWASPRPARQ